MTESGKQFGSFLQNETCNHHATQQFLSDIYPRETKT